MQYFNNSNIKRPEVVFNKRLEKIAWGSFLVMIGVMALAPDGIFPTGSLFTGTGLILLGMNAVRFIQRIDTSAFTIFLGLLALLTGINEYLGITFLVLPIFIIVMGLFLVYKSKHIKL